LEWDDIPFGGDEEEVADLTELRIDPQLVLERLQPREGELREADVHLGRELEADPTRVLSRGAGAEPIPLEHDDASGAATAQVIRDRGADDAAADDDDVGARHCSGGTADGAMRTIARSAL